MGSSWCCASFQAPPVPAGYAVEGPLGRGRWSEVVLARRESDGARVAVKVVRKASLPEAADVAACRRELDLLRRLDHPHVVRVLDCVETDAHFFAVTEACLGGTLLGRVRARAPLSEADAAVVAQQLLDALAYLHDTLGVTHRDIKPENVLLREGEPLSVALADFGFAVSIAELQSDPYVCGSAAYVAPELIVDGLANADVDESVDMWALGVLLFAVLSGRLPFGAGDVREVRERVLYAPEYPDSLSEHARDFLRCLLMKDSHRRVRAARARRHPWFAHVVRAEKAGGAGGGAGGGA